MLICKRISLVASLVLLTNVSLAIPTGLTAIARRQSASDDSLKFDYSGQKVRGVNLGGWLVLEPWITPSIFAPWSNGKSVKDEYTFCKVLGKTEAKRRLSSHWDSWITLDDFKAIKKAGLNHVRIPIGYWAVLPRDGDPYVQGAYSYLSEAVTWAEKAGLYVLIDLHGAVGSQNGFDNSGRYGPINWGKQGDKYDTVNLTLKAIEKIRHDFSARDAVVAIELLNEPIGSTIGMQTVYDFYGNGWYQLRKSHVAIVIHDAFAQLSSWNNFGNNLYNLILDTHHYEIFDDSQVGLSIDDHVKTACDFGNQMASINKWTISGEWTGATTDCAKWLNGLGKGARYDGTFPSSSYHGSCDRKYSGKVQDLSQTEKTNIRRFIEAQLDAYDKAKGWIFWTWKTESAPEWHMKDLLANGLFPQPLSDRRYPGQCG